MDEKKEGSDSSPKTWGFEILKAHMTRRELLILGHYPTRDLISDESHDVYEGNVRQRLPELLDKLDRNDLVCIYRLVELWSRVAADGVFECKCGMC